MPSIWKLGGLTWKELLRRTWHRFWKDRVLDKSAMLSFYFLLSIFPLLLFLMALLGLLLQSGPALQETLHQYLESVVPRSVSTLIDTTLDEITRGSGPVTLSVALLFAWWPASQGMMAIVEGLNLAYEEEESRPWWNRLPHLLLLLAVLARERRKKKPATKSEYWLPKKSPGLAGAYWSWRQARAYSG